MKLADSGFTADHFIKFVNTLSAPSYDEPVSNYEEGIVYLNDTDYIEADECVVDNEVRDDGKYQDIYSVYKYVDKEGEIVYLKESCTRSGSYFSDYEYQDYALDVVQPHTKVIIEYY